MELNKDQATALQDFADVNGRYWKNKLIQLWNRGQDGGLLRQVRNAFGPVWILTKCKIKPEKGNE